MEIREKIVCSAQKMFPSYGIRSITMDMIAEQMGISKRTIYENFKDKDELIKSCIDDAVIEHKKTMDEIVKNSENVIDAMFKVVKYNVRIMNSVNPMFFHDIKKYYSEVNKQTLDNRDEKIINHSIILLNRGIKENLFKSDINVEIVAILFSEQFKMMNDQNIFPEEKFSKAEVFENIVINFMRGIATNDGLALIEKYSK